MCLCNCINTHIHIICVWGGGGRGPEGDEQETEEGVKLSQEVNLSEGPAVPVFFVTFLFLQLFLKAWKYLQING